MVLPFVNLAGDAEHELIADGLTEDVTTDLSRLSGSFVIARNTAFTYKGRQVDAQRVGQELGVRYVLEGSIRRGTASIRANIQLIDALSGAHVWAERLDRESTDRLGLQDEITARIANALRVELLRSAARDAERRAGHKTEALDLLLRARSLRQKPSTVQTLGEARQLFEQASALDAGLIDGWAGLAYVTSALVLNFPDHNRETHLSIAEEAARRALTLDPHHAESHFALGRVRLTQGRLEEAAAEFEEAINLDRNHASAHTQLGLARMFQGRAEDTISLCLRAMRLSPRDPVYGNWQMFIGIAHLQLSSDQEAKSWLQRAVVNNPRYYLSRAWLAAAQWLTGDEASARDSIAMTLSLNPQFRISNSTGGIALTEATPEFLRRMSRVHNAWHAMGVLE